MHALTSQGTLHLVTDAGEPSMSRPTRHPREAAMPASHPMTIRIGFRTGRRLLVPSGGPQRRAILGEENP
jgi:hypothetical protein